jgi:hypothetical protein
MVSHAEVMNMNYLFREKKDGNFLRGVNTKEEWVLRKLVIARCMAEHNSKFLSAQHWILKQPFSLLLLIQFSFKIVCHFGRMFVE